MKAIILAAGSGSRLLPITKELPKCLIKVSDRCILDYQIEALHELGITDIAIITGYLNKKIEAHLNKHKITFIHNADYLTTNNAYSLWLARDFIKDDTEGFVVMNSDLIFQSSMLQALLSAPISDGIVVEKNVNPDSDMVKITMDGNRICYMNKKIAHDSAHAEAVGPVKFSQTGGKKFMEHIEKDIINGNKTNWFFYTISDYAQNNPFFGFTNPGFLWAEVDTSEDLELARKIIPKKFK